MIASAWPRSRIRAASARADRLDTSPSVIELFGPRASWAMPTWQAGMFGKYFNIHSGNNSAIAAWPQRWKSNVPSTRQPR